MISHLARLKQRHLMMICQHLAGPVHPPVKANSAVRTARLLMGSLRQHLRRLWSGKLYRSSWTERLDRFISRLGRLRTLQGNQLMVLNRLLRSLKHRLSVLFTVISAKLHRQCFHVMVYLATLSASSPKRCCPAAQCQPCHTISCILYALGLRLLHAS